MKKVIGLCLIVLLGSTSAFAVGKRGPVHDPSIRVERMIAELRLKGKQADEFRKIQREYIEQVRREREEMRKAHEARQRKLEAIREKKEAELRKLLSEEQYWQYLRESLPTPPKDRPLRKGGRHW